MPAPRPVAFWSVATLLILVLAASGVPTPLYRVYQQEFGFGAGVLTTIFGVYALTLLAALLVVGGLSDHVGRRPVLAASLLVQAASMVLFLLAGSAGWLMAARSVQGVATGVLTATLGAALLDFQDHSKPRGALLNTVSPGIGLAAGAFGAALLVEYLAHPADWVFGVLTAVFVAAAVGVLLLPESSPRLPGAVASLRPRVHVPAAQRRAFLVALPCVVALWALSGLYLSLGPSLVAAVFGIGDHLVGSLVIVALNGTGAVGALLTRGLRGDRGMALGALSFAVGVVGTVASLAVGWLPLFLGGAVVSGFGFGAAFLGAIATITRGVAPGSRAGLLSAVFVVGYLALCVPAIAAGVSVGPFGLTPVAEVYGGVVVLLALVAVAGLRVSERTGVRAGAVAPEPGAAALELRPAGQAGSSPPGPAASASSRSRSSAGSRST